MLCFFCVFDPGDWLNPLCKDTPHPDSRVDSPSAHNSMSTSVKRSETMKNEYEGNRVVLNII